MNNKILILLDGECTLCSHFGIMVSSLDKKDKFRFTSQQAKSGKKIMNDFNCEHEFLKTILVCHNGKYWTKSDAILKILKEVSIYTKLIGYLGYLCPKIIRNILYDFVSKRRHIWFGTEACKMPPKHYKMKILK